MEEIIRPLRKICRLKIEYNSQDSDIDAVSTLISDKKISTKYLQLVPIAHDLDPDPAHNYEFDAYLSSKKRPIDILISLFSIVLFAL